MPKYQDDSYAAGKMRAINKTWGALKAALEKGGHELNIRKSEFWIPGCDEISPEMLPGCLHAFCDGLPRAFGGLKIMG